MQDKFLSREGGPIVWESFRRNLENLVLPLSLKLNILIQVMEALRINPEMRISRNLIQTKKLNLQQ